MDVYALLEEPELIPDIPPLPDYKKSKKSKRREEAEAAYVAAVQAQQASNDKRKSTVKVSRCLSQMAPVPPTVAPCILAPTPQQNVILSWDCLSCFRRPACCSFRSTNWLLSYRLSMPPPISLSTSAGILPS